MLYLIATPIGNIGDISYRAIEILKEIDVIACEDTRAIRYLLKEYQLEKKLISFHEHNEKGRVKQLLSMLQDGQKIALVSDRGTPCISDPGFLLVQAVINEGISFTVIPGATAFLTALIISGFAMHSFLFKGFPPRKTGKRKKFFEVDKNLPYTLIYYESPYRIKAFLENALTVLGNRRCVIANDLTKSYEKISRGNLEDLRQEFSEKEVKGEFSIVIEGLETANFNNAEDE